MQVTKTDGQNFPLSGATFELRGVSGYAKRQTTGENGTALWEALDPADSYTRRYAHPSPMQVVISANITTCTTYATIRNDNAPKFRIQKLDKQNNRVLQGAVFELTHIDGNFKATGRTEFDGVLELGTEALPFGSSEIRKFSAPEVYRDTEPIGSYITDSEGKIMISVNPGVYLVKEV